MKAFPITISLIFLSILASAQSGISFFDGDLDSAKVVAANEEKLIFIDTYAVWCGPCHLMDRETFPDPSVSAFFNEHFVNVKVDVDRKKGREFADKHNIKAIPTLMFMDPAGNVILEKKDFFAPHLFLKLGEKARKRG